MTHIEAMPFVKLDCGILDSTLWFDREAREIFLTALLMASPVKFDEDIPEIATRSLNTTGWVAPAGEYGFVPAASVGIIARSGMTQEQGLAALERLASPEENSRSPEFDGRRLIRIDGGFLVLNYMKYRDKDYTAAARAKRYRKNKRNAVMVASNTVTSRNVTQAEAEAEADVDKRGRFTPPAVEEIRRHIAEKGYTFDAEAFHAYYEARGWKLGTRRMSSWKAACVTWQKREPVKTDPAAAHYPSMPELIAFNKTVFGLNAKDYLERFRQKFGCDPKEI